uniref:Uncharacterized protein n=1 Tax=Arundo donax TaxID=35708 RepID=A0A0A9H3Z6_ARUDO
MFHNLKHPSQPLIPFQLPIIYMPLLA